MRLPHCYRLISIAVLITGLISGPVQAGTGNRSGSILINGLEWALATNGENITWPDAVEYCSELTLAGRSDWRLPTMDELKNLHEPGAKGGEGIRNPFSIGDCCLWSGESLMDRPAEDGDDIGGSPEMYHWGFMFDGGLPYYAVNVFDDGRALCTRDAGGNSR